MASHRNMAAAPPRPQRITRRTRRPPTPTPAAVPVLDTSAPAIDPADLKNPALYINRELSWLEFNRRVLAQALDPAHPLLERVKFLSIVATNLDEFFMIRVSAMQKTLLEGLEDARKSLATHLEERARLDVELNDARDDLARVEKALDAEHATVTQQRADIAKEIPDDLLRAYDKIRVDNGGVGAALLQHGRCGGCRLQITANELARIKAAPSNEVLRCEECRRIMVRTGESGL